MSKPVSRHVALAVSLALSNLSFAGEPGDVQAFEIKPQPLTDALRAYADRTGEQVVFFSEVGLNRESTPVSGRFTHEGALQKLLENTGLSYQRLSPKTVAITDQRRGATAAAPGAVRLAQAAAPTASVQSTAAPQASEAGPSGPVVLDEVVVTGSQIQGSKLAGVLPITFIDRVDVLATGAVSGDELFRTVPQAGDVRYQSSRITGNLNDARGDVASINLRSLGTGNTLMLLNGRRMVLHPGSQTEFQVPTQTANTNSIPLAGIDRVEILRDGAAAIYGADAVAGVVNTVLEKDYEGVRGEAQYGGAERGSYREQTYNIKAGHRFNDKTQVNFFGGFVTHDALLASERPFSASEDHRALVSNLNATDSLNFDLRLTSSPWAVFDMVTPRTVRQGTTALTNASGQFHIEPSTNTAAGCTSAVFADGTCIRSGLQSTVNDRVLRYDRAPDRTLLGDVKRANVFTTIEHDLTDNLQLFGELGYYHADFEGQRETSAILSTSRIAIPASNYWNPFGPTTLNGKPNPNRLTGLTTATVPTGGLALILRAYAPVDAGPRTYDVTDSSYRALTGVRGYAAGFDWESALLYSEAKTEDVTHNAVSNTLFQQALAKTTADAYNPFNGGSFTNFSRGDATPNSQATINSFLVDVNRTDKTSLAMWDLKASRPDVFKIWSGDIALATGVEVRRETYSDDRDDRLDGTIKFTDMVTGVTFGSDVMGASGAPDVKAHRTVSSAFLEFAVPLVSNEMDIPLVREVTMQLAGRDEHYSDFGNVFKPKAALSWKVVDSFAIRTAWSQSFRAPNLPQYYSSGSAVSNTATDWAQCRANGVADAACVGVSTTSIRSGNQNLKPEDADNFTAGVVFQPTFLPTQFGRLTVTADYWSINEKKVIGIIGDTNNLALDYLLRARGSSNPAVVRNAPTAGQTLGDVQFIADTYLNLNPRKIEGVDSSLTYELNDTPAGKFTLKLNAAKLLKFEQEASAQLALLQAAQASGELPTKVTVNGVGDFIGQDGTPRYRGSAGITWSLRGWGAGAFANYVGSTYDGGFVLTDGSGARYKYDSFTTVSLYAQKSLQPGGVFGGTTFRLGVRNVGDTLPPVTASNAGYNAELASPLGRYWYASLAKKF